MRKTKLKGIGLLALLTAVMMVAGCSGEPLPTGTVSPAGSPAPSATGGTGGDMDHSETEIGVMRQDYEDALTAEILMIKYDGSQPALEEYDGKHPEIEMLNNEISAGPLKILQDYENGNLDLETEPNGIEILSYPLADEDFLQIVTTCVVYPETVPADYTRMWSYCYSLAEDRIITVDDMLGDYKLTKDDISEAFTRLYEGSEGEKIAGINVSGFLINRVPASPKTHFLLEVMLETESDPYMCFFMYTPDNDEIEELDPALLLNPDFYDLLSMDPPLRYESGENGGTNGGSGGEGGYSGSSGYAGYRVTVDTSGMKELTKHCEYSLDDLHITMHAYPPTGDSYDESTMTTRIGTLENVSRIITVSESEEHSGKLTYPAWMLTYETGENEDTRHCVDIYFQTDSAEYRVHTSVPVDMRTDYHDEVGKRLATINMVADGSAGGQSDEEITDDPAETETPNTGSDPAETTEYTVGGEDEAYDIIAGKVDLGEGQELWHVSDSTIDGKHAWEFAVGSEVDGELTAEQYYAVTQDGYTYKRGSSGNYEPF